MFRILAIIGISLVLGITAKPWNKLVDDAIQETVLSLDDNGKLSLQVEVEPSEDMDGISYQIDPRMSVWKSMSESEKSKRPLKAEVDLKELSPPLVPEVLPNLHDVSKMQYKQEAEGDRDDVHHPVFMVAAEEPEEDLDEAYEKAREQLAEYLVPLVAKYNVESPKVGYQPEKDEDQLSPMKSEEEFRVYLQPEKDMDNIYHKDPLMPALNQDNMKHAAIVNLPFQGKYTKPEEDLDHIYHQ